MIVAGLDLALIRTGYAVLDDGALVGSGVIVTTSRTPMPLRLLHIRDEVYGVLRAYGVEIVAAETSEHFQRDITDKEGQRNSKHSIEALAQARAAALIACAEAGVKVVLANPAHVKYCVAGSVHASKLDVIAALRLMGHKLPVKRSGEVDDDVADAIGIAYTIWCEERLKALAQPVLLRRARK